MSKTREKKAAPRKRAAAAGARSQPATRPRPRTSGSAPAVIAGEGASDGVLVRHRIEVRWRDLDAFNHVNNANFLTYIEEARVSWLRHLASDWDRAAIAPLLAAVQINYRQPIEWPATLSISLSAERIGTTSLTLGHRIVDADHPDRLYADGHSVLVWIDRASARPIPLPEDIRCACAAAAEPTDHNQPTRPRRRA